MAGTPQSKAEFVQWVKQNDPFLYQIAIERYKLKNAGQGLGFDWGSIGGVFNQLVTTVKEVAPSVVNMQAQKKILDLQIKRAEQGLEPLNVDQYTPAVRVEPVITPETQQAAKNIATETIKQGIGEIKLPLLLLGGGILAAFLMRGRGGRRRR